MHIQYGSVHHRILERLCTMPKAVRGMSGAMLQRLYGSLVAVQELAGAGLLRQRGWADGPGAIWIPTVAGEALYRDMKASHQSRLVTQGNGDRVILPQRSS